MITQHKMDWLTSIFFIIFPQLLFPSLAIKNLGVQKSIIYLIINLKEVNQPV